MLAALTLIALQSSDPVAVNLTLSNPNTYAGAEFLYAVEFTPQPDWHLYWKNPGDSGLAPTIKWELPAGWKASDFSFPAPTRLATKDEVTYIYKDKVSLLGRIQIPQNAEAKSYELKGTVSWMACHEFCKTGETQVVAILNVGKDSAKGGMTSPAFLGAITKIPNQKLAAEVLMRGNNYIVSATLPAKPTSAYFFADQPGVANHAPTQKVQIKGNQLTIEVGKSEFASKPVGELTGILEVTTDSKVFYYVIQSSVSR